MLLLNFALFQVSWFACVVGAANSQPWLGVIVTIMVLAWHLYQTNQAHRELKVLLSTMLIGALLDQSLLSLHLIDYQHHGWHTSIVPVWILALWLAFATTLNTSLAWMHKRYWISFIFGMLGGPLAYMAAEKLGAVTITSQLAYVALAVGWAMITPLLLLIAHHINSVERA